MTEKSLSRQSDVPVPFPWLTLEVALWGSLAIIALGLRLLRLNVSPLNTAEARDALVAWRFAQGQGASSATGYSPVLFSGQSLIFLIFGANELGARLLPALAGAALTLMPSLLRSQLGRLGALAAGILLCFSPTALTLSRTASGDVLVALGALALASGFWRFVYQHHSDDVAKTRNASHTPEPKNQDLHSASHEPAALLHESQDGPHPSFNVLHESNGLTQNALSENAVAQPSSSVYLAALGIALMLVASSLTYSAVVAMGSALALWCAVSASNRIRFRQAWHAFRATPHGASYAVGLILGGSVLLSTAFAWHVAGLGAAADLLPHWLRGFVRWSDSLSLTFPGVILVFYEPLILLTGASGIVLATLRRNNPTALFFALWSIVALLLALIRPGRGPGDVLLVLLPLSCTGGFALNALLGRLRRRSALLNEGLYFAVSVPLWAYLVINLATYTGQPGDYSHIRVLILNMSVPTYFGMAVLSVVVLLILATGIGFVYGAGSAVRGFGISASVALLFYTLATGLGVSQNRLADPRELLILEPTASEVRLLTESLTRLSYERHGGAHAIDVTVLMDDPALTWALRSFSQARYVATPEQPISSSVVIAPKAQTAPPLGGNFVGQSFPLRRRWAGDSLKCSWPSVPIGQDQVRQLDCNPLVEWILFRRTEKRPVEEQIVLWLRQDETG